MCGIYFSKSCFNDGSCKELGSVYKNKRLRRILQNRGPDVQNQIQLPGLLFAGFVLWQQGSTPSVQPLENDKWILLLNGDVFNGDKDEELSDSEWLLDKLTCCDNDEQIMNIFRIIEGPFSVIFYNKQNKEVFFGRDSLGRNSLLLQKNDTEIIISSTLGKENGKHLINNCYL